MTRRRGRCVAQGALTLAGKAIGMVLRSLRFSVKLPVEPSRLYEAWLDSKAHSAFTGGPAKIEPRVGGHHTAWGDYIQGIIVELELGKRIVQTWRASEFPADAADSRVELLFEPDGKGGTLMALLHTDIPEDLVGNYEQGWSEYYFKPMRKYFQLLKDKAALKRRSQATKAALKSAAAKASDAKKAPAKKAPAKKAPAKKAPASKRPTTKSASKKTITSKAPAKTPPRKTVRKG